MRYIFVIPLTNTAYMHNRNKDNSTETFLANEIGFNDVDIYITNPLYFRYTDVQVSKQVQLDAFVDNFEINKDNFNNISDNGLFIEKLK